jgi:glutaminase
MPLANAGGMPAPTTPLQSYLADLHSSLTALEDGAVATYIPELAKVDANRFGICLVTMDGVAYGVGDVDTLFTIQSISKALVYATTLADRGRAFLETKVGVEPTGDAFNSISLDPQTGAPLNPMINAGAIATTSLVSGATVGAQWNRIATSMDAFAGRELAVDEAVYRSESDTGFRNRAIAWMLKNFGIVESDPMASLENYFRQCSILVNCCDLACMAATLANDGVHPATGKRAMPQGDAEQVLSVMATCGMYDYAGSWLHDVGMPAKSGVGGGIIAVVPGRFGIGIFSPKLDAKGNSVRGIAACERLSRDFGLHVFARTSSPSMALGRVYTAAVAPSRVQRAPAVRTVLREQAHRIKYLCLHGFLGLDGAEYVVRKMEGMAGEASSFILDMHEAIGLSESAARLLNMARLDFADRGIPVVCSRVRGRPVSEPLSKSVRKDDRGFLVFEDNDVAAEWCENRLVPVMPDEPRRIGDSILFARVPAALLREVEAVTRELHYAKGEEILRQGEDVDGRVFFIESGHVSVVVPLPNGAHQRVMSLGPGMEFGEMALLGQTTRSASVFADTEVRCRVLDLASWTRLAETRPALRIAVVENLAKELASRLRGANQWISALA